jgi:RNA polymerase sigma factor (sigma-70 family)
VAVFPNTSRSILQDLGSTDERTKQRARERFAEQYWTPIYTYVRCRWRLEPERAAEVTQDLFLRDLEREMCIKFDPELARFRTFLRTCADNLVRDQARYELAAKRHGNSTVAWEDAEHELTRLDTSLSPEDAFEHAWRMKVLALARARLDENLRSRGKAKHADVFAMFHDEDPPPSYADAATRLEVSVTDVTNWLHVARREWRTQFSLVLREGGISQDDLAAELARGSVKT